MKYIFLLLLMLCSSCSHTITDNITKASVENIRYNTSYHRGKYIVTIWDGHRIRKYYTDTIVQPNDTIVFINNINSRLLK